MERKMLGAYLREAIELMAIVSGIPLLVASMVGLVTAVLQAATQIQEQSISYCVKFIAVGGALLLLSGWFWNRMIDFVQAMLGSIAQMGALS
jgi:type III secretion protein S